MQGLRFAQQIGYLGMLPPCAVKKLSMRQGSVVKREACWKKRHEKKEKAYAPWRRCFSAR
jgi:hypothetical protein